MAENEDDLSIDLSGVKRFFQGIVDVVRKKERAAPEVMRVVDFVKKHAVLIVLLLVVAMQFVPNAGFLPWGGLWMRLQSEKLPLIEEWGRNSVHDFYRNQIAGQISQQYPNLPDANKAKLVNENLAQVIKGQEAEVKKQVNDMTSFLKEHYQYEYNGVKYTYMPDIDPYFYLRRMENYFKNGHLGDTLRNGVPWDTHIIAPTGNSIGPEMHYYALIYLHKVFSFFKDLPPMQTATYLPVIVVLFAVIFAFLAGHRLAGLTGGVFSATMISISTAGVGRTTWGHADTDAYNLFFPMLILWCLIEAFEAETLRRRVGFLVGLSAAVGLYSFAWIGWWYLFDFIVFALVVYAVYLVWVEFQNKKDVLQVFAQPSIKFVLFFLGAFIVLSGFFVRLFIGYIDPFLKAPLSPFDFRIIKAAAHVDLWPNVYTTVAELNPIDVEGIINTVGGRVLFGLAIVGIVLLALRYKKRSTNVLYASLLSVFLAGAMYASTKGVRFTLLLVPAFSLAVGMGIGLVVEELRVLAKRHLHIPYVITFVVVILVGIGIILQSEQVESSFQNARGDIPLVNDAWFNALTTIKEQSPENAVVNSWWDFGHHFKYFADRAVTFDGGSQNSPMAHWIGRVLLTEDEDEAVGILRMLDCGSHYKAWDALIPQVENDTVRAVKTLYKIFPIHNKLKAREILVNEGLKDPDAVLEFTHCENPPENYFIVSEDMVGKSGVWSHFGSWNFERAYTWIVLRNQPKEKAVGYMINNFNYSKETAEQIYYEVKSLSDESAANAWISPWLGYPMGRTSCSQDGPFSLQCDMVSIDLKNNDARIRTQQGLSIPKYFVYVNESTNALQKVTYSSSNADVAIVLIPRQGGYTALMSSSQLGASMFTRLFFMEGHGLKYFVPVTSQNQITSGAIHVYKTDWKAHEPLVASALRPKTTVEQGSTVSVNYVGYLKNGTVFDASIPDWTKKNVSSKSDFDDVITTPLSFVVGAGQTIPGFEQGLLGMNVSEEKVLKILPEQAYGTDPLKHPLGNQTLNFKIRIEKIR